MLNHDTPKIKSRKIFFFLTNCQILLSIRLNMLTKQKRKFNIKSGMPFNEFSLVPDRTGQFTVMN